MDLQIPQFFQNCVNSNSRDTDCGQDKATGIPQQRDFQTVAK